MGGWGETVIVHQLHCTDYSIEVEFATKETKGNMWAVIVYASNKEKVRKEQWIYGLGKRSGVTTG